MADGFTIAAAAPDRLEAEGDLSYATAARALHAGLALIPHGGTCTIDLSRVREADSAGLAVLVEWLATARARKATLHYVAIPTQILAVAQISDLDDILTQS